MQLDWDDTVPESIHKSWLEWAKGLSLLDSFDVPRCVTVSQNVSLIGFCDASEKAYAAAIYLREVTSSSDVKVTLLVSKSRVAPLKKMTIPRLELLAALILSRLMNFVRDALSCHGIEILCFSDSLNVIHWIKRIDRDYKQFVHNRVTEIRKLCPPNSWFHVAGDDNPADLPSRGVSTSFLMKSSLWWNGPSWLTLHPLPQSQDLPEVDMTDKEERKDRASDELNVETVLTTIQSEQSITPASDLRPIINSENFSSFTKLVRVTAFVLRFVHNLKASIRNTKKRVSYLTNEEFQEAKLRWLLSVQQEYEAEHKYFRGNGPKTPLIQSLQLQLDENNLIRCSGRIQFSGVPYSSVNPIIIPKSSAFTLLIVSHNHEVLLHAGVAETLAQIREEFWIPHGRAVVKMVLRKCVVCKKVQGAPYNQPVTAPLPGFRLQDISPFQSCGIDFAGPLLVQSCNVGVTVRKVYVLLITCASTRAVHLEVVNNMSVIDFIMALKRFCARRGYPSEIVSDNFKTFKCAAKLITSEESQRFMTNHQITWTFIVERAPWWGGFYERLVESMKLALKKAIGKTLLKYEELVTCLLYTSPSPRDLSTSRMPSSA